MKRKKLLFMNGMVRNFEWRMDDLKSVWIQSNLTFLCLLAFWDCAMIARSNLVAGSQLQHFLKRLAALIGNSPRI